MAYIRKHIVEVEIDGSKYLRPSIIGKDFVTVEYGQDKKSRLIGDLTAEVVADILLCELVIDKLAEEEVLNVA